MLHSPRLTKRIKAFAITISIAAALVVAGVVFAAPVLVDHFDTGPQVLTVQVPFGGGSGGSASVSGSVSATLSLGGERDAILTASGGSLGISRTAEYEILVSQGNGVLSVASEPYVGAQAHVEWDGSDGDPANLNTVGLSGVDLTDVSTDDAFLISVLFDDLPGIQATVRVYTSTRSAQFQFTFPGSIASGQRVDFIAPFSAFTPSGGWTTADWQNVGAITLDIDGQPAPGADFVIELLETTGNREYGDLPSTYGTLVTDTLTGPSHQILTGLRLGDSLDAEANGSPSSTATGDDADNSPDDEDGIIRSAVVNWSVLGGGRIRYIVKGCSNNNELDCYVHGWIDFNTNGDFGDPGENMMNLVLGGDVINFTNHNFSIPAGTVFSNTLNARFRVCGGNSGSNDCASPNGSSATGEVEDYQWTFGPNAVTLESLQAQSTTSPVVPVALVGVAAMVLASAVLFVRRKKTA